jgi:alcohol dehydrogenase class IV
MEICARELVTTNRCVRVITSPSGARFATELRGLLQRREIRCTVDDSVDREPTVSLFRAVLERSKTAMPDCIVGLGGGSALDTAKLVAGFLRSEQALEAAFGSGLLSSRDTGLICLPTTAGTGSEVSPNAILMDEEQHMKRGIVSPFLVPDATYIDPLLMVSMPPNVTAYTGLDALAHCIEAHTNKFAHPVVDLYAIEGVRLAALHLLDAIARPDDIEARESMALAGFYGGLCLGPVNTAAVHAFAYPLAGEFKLPHGLAVALLLPAVFEFNIPASPERHAAIALALGVPRVGSNVDIAFRGAKRLRRFVEECGVEMTQAAFGMTESAIRRMSANAVTIGRLLKNNPREVTVEDAARIYRHAFLKGKGRDRRLFELPKCIMNF